MLLYVQCLSQENLHYARRCVLRAEVVTHFCFFTGLMGDHYHFSFINGCRNWKKVRRRDAVEDTQYFTYLQ